MLKEKFECINNFLKKHLKILFVIFGFMIVLVIGIIGNILFNNQKFLALFSEGAAFKSEYESLNGKMTEDGNEYPQVHLSDTDIIRYASIDDVLKILDNGYGVIYFGSAECLYCRSAVQVLMDTAKGTDLKDLYYFDIEKYINEYDINSQEVTETENSSSYDKLLEELGDKFFSNNDSSNDDNSDLSFMKTVSVPLVLFVVRGDIVSYNMGTLFSQEDPYIPLDESQVDGLGEIYLYGIHDVLEGIRLG